MTDVICRISRVIAGSPASEFLADVKQRCARKTIVFGKLDVVGVRESSTCVGATIAVRATAQRRAENRVGAAAAVLPGGGTSRARKGEQTIGTDRKHTVVISRKKP
jgi:hypothetical protein